MTSQQRLSRPFHFLKHLDGLSHYKVAYDSVRILDDQRAAPTGTEVGYQPENLHAA